MKKISNEHKLLLRLIEKVEPPKLRKDLAKVAMKVITRDIERKHCLDLIQEDLPKIREAIVHNNFDLWATRNERDALQRRLDAED